MGKPRISAALGLAITIVIATGCPGGGGGFTGTDPGGMMPGGMGARFIAADASPGALTVSMASGDESEADFEVRILVTDVNDFFGAAFRVTFDDAIARYTGFSAAGSFLLGSGITTDFRADPDPGDPGTILVTATRRGQVQGVTAAGSQLLLTLSFSATTTTAGSNYGFDTAATREVTTCPAPPTACTTITDSSLTWSGGTLVAN